MIEVACGVECGRRNGQDNVKDTKLFRRPNWSENTDKIMINTFFSIIIWIRTVEHTSSWVCVRVCEFDGCDALPARRPVHPAARHRYWWVAAREGTHSQGYDYERTMTITTARDLSLAWLSQAHWSMHSHMATEKWQGANLLRFN